MAEPSNDQPKTDDASGASDVDWRSTHLWQIQPVRDVLLVLLVFGLLYLGKLLSIVTVPLLLALLLAYLFEPVVGWLCRKSERITRQGAATIIIVTIVAIGLGVAGGLAYGVSQAVHAAGNLVSNVSEVRDAVSEVLEAERAARDKEEDEAETAPDQPPPPEEASSSDVTEDDTESEDSDTEAEADVVAAEAEPELVPGSAADLRQRADRLREARREALPSELWRGLYDNTLDTAGTLDNPDALQASPVLAMLNEIGTSMRPSAGQVGGVIRPTVRAGADLISSLLSFTAKVALLLMGAFFTAFFFFFISTGYPAVVERLRSFIPEKHRERTDDLASKFDRVINGFIRGRLTVAFVLGGFLSIAYLLIGVPGAFIVGPIIGVLSIAPYVSLVGIPVTIVLLLLDPSGWFAFQNHWLWAIAAPTVVYFIAQSLDDYVLTPIIQGKTTDMDTPTILFATLAGGALAGFYGVLLAIPVAACAKIALTELFWPRFKAWTEGKERDFLPISRD